MRNFIINSMYLFVIDKALNPNKDIDKNYSLLNSNESSVMKK
jgi:hypothetical protein